MYLLIIIFYYMYDRLLLRDNNYLPFYDEMMLLIFIDFLLRILKMLLLFFIDLFLTYNNLHIFHIVMLILDDINLSICLYDQQSMFLFFNFIINYLILMPILPMQVLSDILICWVIINLFIFIKGNTKSSFF